MPLKGLIFYLGYSLLLHLIKSQSIITSPGIVITEETGQVLYEATAPIIYQFESPNWNNFLSIDFSEECNNNQSISKYCNIFDKFSSIAAEIQTAITPATFTSFPEETHSSTWGLKCNIISQHFSSFRVDSGIVQKYLGFLRSCSKGVILEEELNTDYVGEPSLNYFQDAKTDFEEEFVGIFDPNEDLESQDGIHLNFLNNLLSSGFSSFTSQASKWNSAISSCKSGLIPDSLVSPTMFQQSLLKLNQTAEESGWRFSISPDSEFLPFYYKNKLADCTFSGNVLYVRVLIPMLKTTRNWRHISSQTIPFYHPSEFINMTKGLNSGTFFYESNSKRLHSSATNCDTSQPGFCKLPDLFDGKSLVSQKNCIAAVLQGLEHSESCETEIAGAIRDLSHLPLVVRENTDIYYLASLPGAGLAVKCQEFDGSESIREFSFPSDMGALKVELPCFCVIILSDSDLELEAEAPCHVLSSALNVVQVLPLIRV